MFHVERPLKYLGTTQRNIQQMLLCPFFQHIPEIEYNPHQLSIFMNSHHSTLYQKTDVPLLFIDETVRRQGDDALATFAQFL